MADSPYMRKFGKLTLHLTIPCDEYIKKLEERSKARSFDFNAWVRDKILANAHEVTEACGLPKDPKSAA
jgi:hypothetical protein